MQREILQDCKIEYSDNSFDRRAIEAAIQLVCGFDDKDSVLSQALHHHFRSGGSRTRARLTYQFSRNLSIPKDEAVWLSCIPELLHNASLIHDDLQDQDMERRNHISVWKKYGADVAICAGDFLISAAYACITRLKRPCATSLISHTHNYINDVIRGQIDDLRQNKDQTLENLAVYKRISMRKSGPLLAMSLSIPLLYSDLEPYTKAAEQVFYPYAVAYQIYDDIQDVDRDQAKRGKKSGVNIVTILQEYGMEDAVYEAQSIALDNLNAAAQRLSSLPEQAIPILEMEIIKMQDRINASRSDV